MMQTTQTALSPQEIMRRGQEIYEREIRDKALTAHKGRMLAVDINSEDYEIDDDSITAIERLKARRCDAIICLLRIGYKTAYTLVGRLQPEEA